MGWRGWAFAALVALAGTAGLVMALRARTGLAGDEPLQTEVVTRGALRQTVGGTGSLVPGRQVQVSFAASGRVAQVLVETGEAVTAGRALAVLDTRTLELDVAAARGSLAAAKSSLGAARSQLAALEAGPGERQIALAKLSLEQARDRLWGTQAQRDGICGRVARGQGQQYECDGANASVLQAEGAVRQAELELAFVLAGADSQELAAALDRVAQAESGLTSARGRLQEAELRLDQATLTAPISGTVTAVNVSAGEMSGTGAAVQISDLTNLQVQVRLDESDVAAVEVGQACVITLDAFPDRELTGRVRGISPVAEAESGVVLFPVTVTLAPADVPARPGMTADVDIVLAVAADALLVPLRAVVSGPGGTAVVLRLDADGNAAVRPDAVVARAAGRARDFPDVSPRDSDGLAARSAALRPLAAAGTPVPVAVRIGLTSESQAEVLAGLAEGDVVVVQGSRTTATVGTRPGGERMFGIGGAFRVP